MTRNGWRTCTALISLLIVAGGRTQQREFALPDRPSDTKVDGGGRVFLAAGSQLFRLDSTLALQENVSLGSSVARVALSSDERRVVVCLGDLSQHGQCTEGIFQGSWVGNSDGEHLRR